MLQINHEKRTTSALLLTKDVEHHLTPPIKSNTFLRSHFDGLVILTAKTILILRVAGDIGHTSVIRQVDLLQPVLNLQDFFSCYRFIAWTPTVST